VSDPSPGGPGTSAPFASVACGPLSAAYAAPAPLGPDAVVPEAPWAAALPVAGVAAGAAALWARHRADATPADGSPEAEER
jgi:hypothetical protein